MALAGKYLQPMPQFAGGKLAEVCLLSCSHISLLLNRHSSRESVQQLCVGRANWTQASSVTNLTHCLCVHLLSCTVGLDSTQMLLPVQIIRLSVMTVSAEKASSGDLKCLLLVLSFSTSIFFWCGKMVHSSVGEWHTLRVAVLCLFSFQHWKQIQERSFLVGLLWSATVAATFWSSGQRGETQTQLICNNLW